jgi:DNA mismatch repair protein MLH1
VKLNVSIAMVGISNSSTYSLVSDIKKKTQSQHKVRTSLRDRTLDSMFPVANPAQIHGIDDSEPGADPPPNVPKSRDIQESECYLTSVRDLRASVTQSKHNRECSNFCLHTPVLKVQIFVVVDLSEILEKHIFVGIVDLDRCLSLLQHSTKLYLVNHGALAYVSLTIIDSYY